MKFPNLIITVICILSIVGCSTQDAQTENGEQLTEHDGGLTSQTHEGIKISITDVETLDEETIVEVRIVLDSRWTQKISEQTSMGYFIDLEEPMLFDNHNTIYTFDRERTYDQMIGPTSSGDLNEETGELIITRKLYFGPVMPEAHTLTIQTSISFFGFPADEVVEIDPRGYEIGDKWELNEVVTFAGIPLPLSTATLDYTDDIMFLVADGNLDPSEAGNSRQLILELASPSSMPPLYVFTGFLLSDNQDNPILYLSNYSRSGSSSPNDQVITTIGLRTYLKDEAPPYPQEPLAFDFVAYFSINKLWQLTWIIEE